MPTGGRKVLRLRSCLASLRMTEVLTRMLSLPGTIFDPRPKQQGWRKTGSVLGSGPMPLARPACAPQLFSQPVGSTPEFARVLRTADPGPALDGPLTFLPPACRPGRVAARLERLAADPFRPVLAPVLLQIAALATRGCAREMLALDRELDASLDRDARDRSRAAGQRLLAPSGVLARRTLAGSSSNVGRRGRDARPLSRWSTRARARFSICRCGCCCQAYAYWEWSAAMALAARRRRTRAGFRG